MVYAKFGGHTECIIGHSKIENYHCYCFCGHFFVGRYWREIGVRVLQESRKRVSGKLKNMENGIFDLKRSFDWDVLLWCCWCTFRYNVRAAGNRLTFYYLLILLIYFFGQQEMKALLREGIPRPCRREVWKRWWSGSGKKLKYECFRFSTLTSNPVFIAFINYMDNFCSWENNTWKNPGLFGIRTFDLCDTGSVLYQWS